MSLNSVISYLICLLALSLSTPEGFAKQINKNNNNNKSKSKAGKKKREKVIYK